MTANQTRNPSRTMTVGEIVDRMVQLDPSRSLPVVFDAVDEPVGNYGVRDVVLAHMQRDDTFADDPAGRDVYYPVDEYNKPDDRYDAVTPVIVLSMQAPRDNTGQPPL